MRQTSACLTCVCLLLPDVLAQVPEFVNGGFEIPVTPFIEVIYTGSSDLVGWRVTGGSVEVISPTVWQPAAGNQSLDMVGVLVRGSIEQDLVFTDVSTYHVTFELSKNTRVAPPTQLGVWYRPPSSTSFIGLGLYEFNEAVSSTDMMWRAEGTASFTSEPGLYTFAFASLSGGGSYDTDTWGGPAIDEVHLVAGASPFNPSMPPSYVLPPPLTIPEPSSTGVGVGVALLGFATWRRRA